jgi:hypothetical protein
MKEPMTIAKFTKTVLLAALLALVLGVAFYLGMGSMSAP